LQISDGLYYNAALTLGILHKLGVASEIFNLWFQMLQEVKKSGVRANFKRSVSLLFTVPPPCLSYLLHTLFSHCNISYFVKQCEGLFTADLWLFLCREHGKKVCCLGLTSLLALPADQLPGEALGRVFRATLDLLVAYKDQVAGLYVTHSP